MSEQMKIEFKYREEKSKLFGAIMRPVGKVTLRNGLNEVDFYPYIDSGADITLIPKSLGEALGLALDESKIEELSGIGSSKIPVTIAKIIFEIGGIQFNGRVASAS